AKRALKIVSASKVLVSKLIGDVAAGVVVARPAKNAAATRAVPNTPPVTGRSHWRLGRTGAKVVDAADDPDSASSAKPRSRADWNRSSGLFSRQRRTIRSSAGGTE